MRRTRAVVFDLYGTLIRIRDDRKAFARLFKELGSESIQGADRAKRMAFTRNPPDLAALARLISPGHSVDVKAYEAEIMGELDRAECFPETLEVLGRLRREGLMCGLISNLSIPYQRPYYDLGISRLIDHAIFSCEIGLKKPDPRIYEAMLKRLGLRPFEAWMIGDNPYCDVRGPQDAGMNAMLLDRDGSFPGMRSVASLDGIFQLLD